MNTVILGFQLLQEHLHSLNIASKVSEKLILECLELTDELSENAAVAVTTLNDLINYDKIETKTFTIEKKMVNICSVTEKTVGLLGPQAKEKAVSILFESEEPNNLRVFGDSVKLAQVIRNLTSNAIKFTPPQGKITVRGTWTSLLDFSLPSSPFVPSGIPFPEYSPIFPPLRPLLELPIRPHRPRELWKFSRWSGTGSDNCDRHGSWPLS